MINEMSWHQFSTLPGMNKLPQHDVERQYRIYLNEIAEQRIAIHLMQERVAMTQAEAMAVAASNGGGGGIIQQESSGCIEFVNNTTDGTYSEITITTSGPTNYTITWGDGTEVTDTIDGELQIDHSYADSDTEYTARLCFDDASLVTRLDFSQDDDASLTSITGLQNLTNLQRFVADDHNLTSVNLSGLSNLNHVDVGDNELPGTNTKSLTSINLSGCTSLTYLRLDDSDFSAGLPDLSDCTSLTYIDFDECGIVGSVDVSNLPVLEDFDFAGNTELTELIISSTQPLGTGGQELIISDCALTQTAVDNILVALASGSISNGYIRIDNDLEEGTNATPGEVGREALLELDDRGWSFTITNGNHTALTVANEALEEDICASTYTITQYIASGSVIEVGNKLYQNSEAWLPSLPGWYRLDGDGSIKFEVSGSRGEIISVDPCV
jgi:hypothetical protein